MILSASNINKLKVLGVIFNTYWIWEIHFDNVSRRIHVLRILKVSLPRRQLIDTYTSLYFYLEYRAPLFSLISTRDSCRLEILQKRFHRTICGNC